MGQNEETHKLTIFAESHLFEGQNWGMGVRSSPTVVDLFGWGEVSAKTMCCVKNFPNNQEEISSPRTLAWPLPTSNFFKRLAHERFTSFQDE